MQNAHMHVSHSDYSGDYVEWWNSTVRRTRAGMVALGIALVLVGIFAAWAPFSMYEFVQIVASVALIVHGVAQVVGYFSMPEGVRSPTLVVAGVLNALLGVMIFALPAYLMVEVSVYMLAFLFIITGIERISFSIKTRHIEESHSVLMMVTGVLNVILGAVFFAAPFFMSLAVSYVVAAYLIIGGAMLIIEAFSMREIKE